MLGIKCKAQIHKPIEREFSFKNFLPRLWKFSCQTFSWRALSCQYNMRCCNHLLFFFLWTWKLDGHDSMRTISNLDLIILIRCLSTKYLRGEIKLSENFRVADKSKTCTGFDHLGKISVMMMVMVVVLTLMVMMVVVVTCVMRNMPRTWSTGWSRV